MLKTSIYFFCLAALLFACSNTKKMPATDDVAEKEWQYLFDGVSLQDWEVLGGDAKFYVEDSTLIGLTEKGLPNCFLVTKKRYTDFILEADFKIDSLINSGIQFRSNTYKKATTTPYLNGKLEASSRDWEAGRVYGYQIEIDPSQRSWTGGFYEEGGRGWLVPLKDNQAAREAFKPMEWNHFRIEAKGKQFKMWINGVQAVNTTDDANKEGFIGLQLHGTKDEKKVGQKVYFKNIKLQEL